MTILRIGRVRLSALPPRIAVPLSAPPTSRALARLSRRGADLFELRLDLFPRRPEADLLAAVKSIRAATALPLIATFRRDRAHPLLLPEPRREALFLALLPLVDAVDLELESALTPRVAAAARRRGVRTILSFHSYRSTPSPARLRALVRSFRAHGGDLLKIAARARVPADAARLLDFTRATSLPLITQAMGPWAAAYRALAPLFGSRLSYAYYRRPVAPGQPSLSELRGLFSRLYFEK